MTDAADAGPDGHLVHVLREVETARLQPDDWSAVDAMLARIEAGDGGVDELTTYLFEAKVRTRFSGQRASASLPPTKQTSVLPLVGLVCGGMLVGVGALLGGGIILVGIAALGLFVFGIAFAGSRVAHRDPGGRDVAGHESVVDPVPMPPPVRQRVERLAG